MSSMEININTSAWNTCPYQNL